jgi:hypothetical protein
LQTKARLAAPTFNCFVGMDQTGAVNASGKPRALPCSVLVRKKSAWRLILTGADKKLLTVPRFSLQTLSDLLRPCGASLGPDTAILADCVMGLPWKSWKRTGERAGDLRAVLRQSADGTAYGRAASEAFFSRWTDLPLPQRECEKLSGSNSVFLTKPYQKNIQTGTYRIWRDMALAGDVDDFSFWPFDPVQRKFPWVFEGYPSFYWKHWFGFKKRDPQAFNEVLSRAEAYGLTIEAPSVEFLIDHPDHADAAVLSLAGLVMQARKVLFEPYSGFSLSAPARVEGWIAGVGAAV